MTTRPPFPLLWDSTMLSTLRACPRKMELLYVQHWKPQHESEHLVAGKAFAAGLEAARVSFYITGSSPAEAQDVGLEALFREWGQFEPPPDTPKTLDRVAGALEYYFSQYPLGEDGATPHIFGTSHHGIEFSFADPLPIPHPETGDPIIFCGRADMVADAFGGQFLYDEKTTTQLGPSWAKKWEHRSQFTGYCRGLRSHGFQPTGIVVRGVAIRKEGYDTAQVITYRSNWEIDRWERQVLADLRRAIQMWETGYWDYNLDDACVAYGGCGFTRVCKSPDPERWLPIYFTQKVWNPLDRTEHLLSPSTEAMG